MEPALAAAAAVDVSGDAAQPPGAGPSRPGSVLRAAPKAFVMPPLYFVGEFDPWMEYRDMLIRRHVAWHAAQAEAVHSQPLAEEAACLFPPSVFSEALAAGSFWRPAGLDGDPVEKAADLFVVTVGGIFGGSDGPAGLFPYLARVLGDSVAFLHLDTGHTLSVAVPVLHAGLQWLLETHPEAAGRIVLAGFSMGSATVVQVGAKFLHAVCGLLLINGQSAGTERLACFAGVSVLIVQGEQDPNVPIRCAYSLAKAAQGAGATVFFKVFPQLPMPQAGRVEENTEERMRRHHLWDERWLVQALILEWLRKLMSERVETRSLTRSSLAAWGGMPAPST